MRSITSIWFECKVRYEKDMEDGLQKTVTENYVVNAMSFTEAEAKIIIAMKEYIPREFTVTDIKQASYKEVIFMDFAEAVLQKDADDLEKAIRKKDKEAFHQWDKETLDEKFAKSDDTGWYKVKLQFITIDEKSEKEKRSNATYLVEACSLRGALDNVDQVMNGTMIDYVQANVGETKILDVFVFRKKEDKESDK